MPFDHQNSQPKLNSQKVLAAAVVGGVVSVPFILATSHHVSEKVVEEVELSTVEEAGTVAPKTVDTPFLIAGPKQPIVK